MSVKDVANYLINSYEEYTDTEFGKSELKLQKLIYFCQREAFAVTGEKLFNETIEGWKHGPVVPALRFFLEHETKNNKTMDLDETAKYIIDNVIAQYAHFSAWYLRNLSHEEFSWKMSREKLGVNDSGNKALNDEYIIEDSKKIRLYDNLYDMYIDEFENVDEENMAFGF